MSKLFRPPSPARNLSHTISVATHCRAKRAFLFRRTLALTDGKDIEQMSTSLDDHEDPHRPSSGTLDFFQQPSIHHSKHQLRLQLQESKKLTFRKHSRHGLFFGYILINFNMASTFISRAVASAARKLPKSAVQVQIGQRSMVSATSVLLEQRTLKLPGLGDSITEASWSVPELVKLSR